MERTEVPRVKYNPAIAGVFLRQYPGLQIIQGGGVINF